MAGSSPAAGSPPEAAGPVTLDALRRAAADLEGIAVKTPLIPAPTLEQQLGVPVQLKGEHLQPVGAFKIRGAYTAISRLPERALAAGVITYSSGNHGQAVAYGARALGTRAVVVMPDHAPEVKILGVQRHGGEVRFGGPTSATRQRAAEAMAANEGFTVIPPFDHPDVILGQATCGLEILDEVPDVDTILVPVGGGGLLAGLCVAVTALGRAVRVIGVEPSGAPKLTEALNAGGPVTLERTESIADGLLPLAIGRLTFPIIQRTIHATIRVPDEDIPGAMEVLFHDCGIEAEPSGAVTTAALLSGTIRPAGPTVAVVSGGNVDRELFTRLVHS